MNNVSNFFSTCEALVSSIPFVGTCMLCRNNQKIKKFDEDNIAPNLGPEPLNVDMKTNQAWVNAQIKNNIVQKEIGLDIIRLRSKQLQYFAISSVLSAAISGGSIVFTDQDFSKFIPISLLVVAVTYGVSAVIFGGKSYDLYKLWSAHQQNRAAIAV